MSTGNKISSLVEEIPESGTKDINVTSDKNNITLELQKKKTEEDSKSMNSAHCSGEELQSKNSIELNNSNNSNNKRSITQYQKVYEKYTERLKEKTMRMEVEKIYNETERLKNKYEEKNSYLHLFDNNPHFRKMLKMVEKQLRYFLVDGLFISIFSSLLYFYFTQRKEGLALSCFCLSISVLSICIILFAGLRLGLLNDPYLSKAFRLFAIIESLLLITAFILTIITSLVYSNYFNGISDFKIRLLIYILFLLMIVIFVISFKFCLNLFIESFLILFRLKTEYSILMIKEQNNNKNEINFNINLSTISNNTTTEAINNNSSDIFKVDNNANNAKEGNKEEKKEEEQYRTFNYYNKFHYSVTSDRNKEYSPGFKK